MAGRSSDVVVVGGGVVGLAIAYELARRGLRATLLDQGAFGRESSWAGAGMISPAPSAEFSASTVATAFDRLRTASYERFAGLAEELKEQAGVDVEYRRCGGVELADSESAMGHLVDAASVLVEQGIVHESLAAADVPRFDRELGDGFLGGLSLPGVCQVRNPRLLVALEEACRRNGVDLRPGTKVVGFQQHGGSLTAVELADGSTVAGGEFVAAAGAWTGRLLEPLGETVPIRPLQGQIVLLRSTPGRFQRVVEVGRRYLVPRGDGLVLVGATEEEVGFEKRPTAVGYDDLVGFAGRVHPGLRTAAVEMTWVGLRPACPLGSPIVGRAPGFRNLWIASGHFRQGVQLAPGTAVVVADWIAGLPTFATVDALGPTADRRRFRTAFVS